MSDQRVISTKEYKRPKLTIRNLTPNQKDAILGGGLSLGAIVAGAGLFTLFGKSETSLETTAEGGETIPSPPSSQDVIHMVSREDIESEDLSSPIAEPVDDVVLTEPYESEVASESYSFYADVNFSYATDDSMSFDEAFATARADVGAGGFFNHQGDSYSTFYSDEWEDMSDMDRADYMSQVEQHADFTPSDLEAVDPVVEDFEVLDTREGATVEGGETMRQDDFFASLSADEVEAVQPVEAPMLSESDAIDDDEFFASLAGDDTMADNNIIIVRPTYAISDNDADGVVDMLAIDDNEDGVADVVALDEDGDGVFESYMINEDGGDNLDVFVIDEGLNGVDPLDAREEIDDIVSMEDFVIIEGDEVDELEGLEMIEGLIHDDLADDDSDADDFDEIGL